METRKRRVISLLVDNQSGVLARVSSLFCRRGFNIDSLTVSATNDPTVSRITVTVSGSDKELQQLILQTERLEVTRQVFVLDHDKALERELLLLKVEADVHNRAELREVGSIYKAKIIDLSPDSMVFELIGKPEKIDAFLKMFDKMIDFLLKKENYIVDCVYNGQDAIDYANLSDYDIIILDWMMPLKSGIEVCRYLRAKNNQTAILMLTARDSLEDKIDGLDSGADDYLAKPFEFPELLARIRALSRRINKTFYNDIIEYNNLKLNCCNAILTYKQIEVSLSPRENQLMELLIRNTHQILPREQIIDKIWGYDTNINSNTLDVTIKSLRQKLTKLSLSDCIHTIRGIGYKFEMDI